MLTFTKLTRRAWELQLEDQQRMIRDLTWEPDVDDRLRQIIPCDDDVEGPAK